MLICFVGQPFEDCTAQCVLFNTIFAGPWKSFSCIEQDLIAHGFAMAISRSYFDVCAIDIVVWHVSCLTFVLTLSLYSSVVVNLLVPLLRLPISKTLECISIPQCQ